MTTNKEYFSIMSHYSNVTPSREVVKLLQFIDMQHQELEMTKQQLEAAREDRAAFERDTRRLDWIEAHGIRSIWHHALNFRLNSHNYREAIDAAMLSQGGKHREHPMSEAPKLASEDCSPSAAASATSPTELEATITK